MKLVEAHVTNFRSAENSEAFKVEQVTCLVGKNEAGKSAILLALAALNPHPSTPVVFDRERDYPRRHLTAYAQRRIRQLLSSLFAMSLPELLTQQPPKQCREPVTGRSLFAIILSAFNSL